MTDKELLRKTVKNLLLREERNRADNKAPILFEQPSLVFRTVPLTSPATCASLFAYLPFGTEADPGEAIRTAFERDIPVAVPRVTGDSLQFHAITGFSDSFDLNRWGISEPRENTPCYFSSDPALQTDEPLFPLLVLVPALAFDHSGARLGRGGGYYDRFLAALLSRYADRRNQITLAGIGFSLQIVDRLPREKHDISVDCLYTDI